MAPCSYKLASGLALGLIGLTLSSCSGDAGTNSPIVKGPPKELFPTLQSVQTDFVNDRCLSCHQTATAQNRQVALVDIALLIEGNGHNHGHGNTGRHLIKPGCPKQSFFLSVMREGKMPPPPGEKVPSETLKIVETWIVELKPNAGNSCNDDEPPDPPEG